MQVFRLLAVSRALLVLAAFALFLAGFQFPAGAVTLSTSKRLTSNSQSDDNPRCNVNGYITWAGFDGHDREIFLYDPVKNVTVQVTNNLYDDELPKINKKNQIVWRAQTDRSDGEYDIFLYSYPYSSAAVSLLGSAAMITVPALK